MRKNLVLVAAAMLALLALGSCGTQNATGLTPDYGNGNAVSSAFKLNVMDETYDFGAAAQDISLAVSAETDTHVVVDVVATGAEGLRGLYFSMQYDPTQFRPMIVEPTDVMGDKADLLNLMAVERPGVMQYGQTLVRQDYQVGFTGTATLAQVSFRKEASPALRSASTPPGPNPSSAVTTLAFNGVDTLTWSYAFQGDYGQDGAVSVADLQPLGANFGDVSTGGAGTPFVATDARSQIDGDSNGVLAVTDLTPIGQNIGKDAFGGFHIYASANAADYPSPATGANGATATDLGSVLVADAVNAANKTTERITFSFTVAAPVANDVYWVRGVDGANAQGIASNFVGGDPANLPALSLDPATPADSGAGTAANPYLDDVDTTDYSFILLDAPGGNDVSTDPNTVFIVTPPAAGAFTGRVLDVATGFTGSFVVTATYNGIPNFSGTNVNFTIGGGVNPIAPLIDKDPADGDWATVTGTGADETNAYILRTDTFNDTYTLTFSLLATAGVGGNVIPNADLDWDAFPPFAVADPAAFTADATAGTFQVWEFTSGYLFAQDPANPGAPGLSNELYVAVNSLPN